MIRVCFVCLGNICRSPTAEGVFRKRVAEAKLEGRIATESAGTGGWHVGEAADPRSRRHAKRRGYVLDREAQQFRAHDFRRFDLVLAVDRSNHDKLLGLAPTPADKAKVRMLLSFDAASPEGAEVPDPYYGGDAGFEEVLDLCERAATGLLAHLRREHGL